MSASLTTEKEKYIKLIEKLADADDPYSEDVSNYERFKITGQGTLGKTSRPSALQLIGLAKFMELNPDLNQGKITNPNTRKRLWKQISEELNKEGNSTVKRGAIKTPEQWRKTWMDKKFSARSKLQRLGTSGNLEEGLSEIEKKILSISGDLIASGEPSISEGGSYRETSTSQTDIQEESSLNGESEMVDTPPSISTSEIENTTSPISKRRRGPNDQNRFILLTSAAAEERFEEIAKKSASNRQVPLLERLARAAEKQQAVMQEQLQVTEALAFESVKQTKLLEKLLEKRTKFK